MRTFLLFRQINTPVVTVNFWEKTWRMKNTWSGLWYFWFTHHLMFIEVLKKSIKIETQLFIIDLVFKGFGQKTIYMFISINMRGTSSVVIVNKPKQCKIFSGKKLIGMRCSEDNRTVCSFGPKVWTLMSYISTTTVQDTKIYRMQKIYWMRKKTITAINTERKRCFQVISVHVLVFYLVGFGIHYWREWLCSSAEKRK